MSDSSRRQALFGSTAGWNSDDWTSSDDRVRGGSSQSYLDIQDEFAIFRGVLDIKTLGGAGFASQRTTRDDRCWNLTSYDGIELELDAINSDQKQYTFILKDEILPKNPDNDREQATISWEYDFRLDSPGTNDVRSKTTKVHILWKDLKPTYRGKEKKDVGDLDLKTIRRISIMMRSFFGTQEGIFRLKLISISAFKDSMSGSESRTELLSTPLKTTL